MENDQRELAAITYDAHQLVEGVVGEIRARVERHLMEMLDAVGLLPQYIGELAQRGAFPNGADGAVNPAAWTRFVSMHLVHEDGAAPEQAAAVEQFNFLVNKELPQEFQIEI